MICPNCKSSNEPGATFCDQCGNPLTGSAPPVAAPAYSPPPPAAQGGGGNLCPSCGTPVIAGEAFCDNCGASLAGGGGTLAPAPVAMPVQPPVPPVYTPPPAAPQPYVASVAAVAATAQVIASNGQTFALASKSTYLLGREDSISGIYPDVDTTGSGGENSGVSRRHAEILQQGSQWVIRDLGSTNGTFVNNQRLAANAQQRLNAGDQIRLGTWAGKFQA